MGEYLRGWISIGRFSSVGIDVHNPGHLVVAGGVECAACSHGLMKEPDWQSFVELMQQHHNCDHSWLTWVNA